MKNRYAASDKVHSALMNGLLVVVAAPIVFTQWLLIEGQFGAGKAIIFIVCMLLIGSFYFS